VLSQTKQKFGSVSWTQIKSAYPNHITYSCLFTLSLDLDVTCLYWNADVIISQEKQHY